jgi:hypothetical protein
MSWPARLRLSAHEAGIWPGFRRNAWPQHCTARVDIDAIEFNERRLVTEITIVDRRGKRSDPIYVGLASNRVLRHALQLGWPVRQE